MLCFTLIAVFLIVISFGFLYSFRNLIISFFNKQLICFVNFVQVVLGYAVIFFETKSFKSLNEGFKGFWKREVDGLKGFIEFFYDLNISDILFINSQDKNYFIYKGRKIWYSKMYVGFCLHYREQCVKFWKCKDTEFFYELFMGPIRIFDWKLYNQWVLRNLYIKLIFNGINYVYNDTKVIYFFSFFYKKIKRLIIPTIICLVFFIYLCNYFYINLLHQLSIWTISGFLFFWLISGFNFFLKKYKYGKFTSIITRFWKRTNIYFWLVEGFLFSLFIYYFLNSSQEPLYMYDFNALNQTYLINLFSYYNSNILLVIFLLVIFVLLLFLVNSTINQNLIFITFLTILFFYIFLVESYQFYYVLTIFYEVTWEFYHEINSWVSEIETPIFRTKHQYTMLALIAKYWHFLFIFVSWVFFIIKIYEQDRTYYTLLGYNIQNIIILFWLNLLFISQWFKWISRRFFDSIYFWFFTDSNFHFISLLFKEIY